MSQESYDQFQRYVKESDRFLPLFDKIFNISMGPCDLKPLRHEIKDEHVLDKYFGIDCVIIRKCEKDPDYHITVQNKTYKYSYWGDEKYWKNGHPSFCQETINAYNTQYQRPGEWTTLTSQMILLAYRNFKDNGIDRWYLLDALKYKLKVSEPGKGLSYYGKFHSASKNGRSAYYTLSIFDFKDCVIDYYKKHEPVNLILEEKEKP